MLMRTTLLSLAVAAALLSGCHKSEDAAPAENAAATATAPSTPEAHTAPEPKLETPAAAPTAQSFDITSIPVSDKTLPEWPYVTLPAGYVFQHADDLASHSKDLARVPVWTGGQLLWVEGKTFTDTIEHSDGKTFSKFEVRKNLDQAIKTLGGVRLSEKAFDEATYKANEKELEDFRQEFSDIRDAYWYDHDSATYVIRRADKAIWVVAEFSNGDAGLMVVEGPLPQPTQK